jgi:hypothetical protein
MRDFRDAKAMAQTLRDAFNAKAVSLTHSESLELIAKILGFHDWNVLSAKIQAESQFSVSEPGKATRAADSQDASRQGAVDDSGEPAPQEIAVNVAILDGYVGFYQADDAVYTVTREENRLITRLTGQRTVEIYARSNTEFFAKIVNAQISFVTDAKGHATSLVLHQGGRDLPMNRIDAATAQKIEGKLAERVKTQTPNAGSEAALVRLIDGITSGNPNYYEMSPGLADAARRQLPNLQRGHEELGAVRSIAVLGVGRRGEDHYTVKHEGGASHWQIRLDSKGTISMALVVPSP